MFSVLVLAIITLPTIVRPIIEFHHFEDEICSVTGEHFCQNHAECDICSLPQFLSERIDLVYFKLNSQYELEQVYSNSYQFDYITKFYSTNTLRGPPFC